MRPSYFGAPYSRLARVRDREASSLSSTAAGVPSVPGRRSDSTSYVKSCSAALFAEGIGRGGGAGGGEGADAPLDAAPYSWDISSA